jgi:hypothetical protein
VGAFDGPAANCRRCRIGYSSELFGALETFEHIDVRYNRYRYSGSAAR